MHFAPCVWALVVSALAARTLASPGDSAQVFKGCVHICQSHVCSGSTPHVLPLALQLMRWTCTDDCRYQCMHMITDEAQESGLPVLQYYGKWPFWRFAGLQEPASVLFSLLNLYAHVQGFLRVRAKIPVNHPMRGYYEKFALVSMNAWIWSSVFHARDVPFTEKMDYFSAALAIFYALYFTAIRIFHLYPSGRHSVLSSDAPFTPGAYLTWTCICVIVYLMHVSYLSFLPRFDYTYNMVFNVAVGTLHNILWLIYALPSRISILRRYPSRPRHYRPACASQAAIFVVLTTGAMALELFDFPPWWRLLDAHALWHLSTIPIAAYWYDFLIADALDEGWRVYRL